MQKKYIYAGALALLTLPVYSQVARKVVKGADGQYPEYVEFNPRTAPTFTNRAVIVSDRNQTSFADAAIISKETDQGGTTHYRLQ